MASITANFCAFALILLSSLSFVVGVVKLPPYKPPNYPPSGPRNDGDAGTRGATTYGDPHFIGAYGTRYDFNGLPGEDYCWFSDSSVHINMHMIGHSYDSEHKTGKAVRTWIGKLGIMWKAGGESHSLVLSARKGPQVERGSGFLASAESDHVALPALQEGETLALAGGVNLTFKGVSFTVTHRHPRDVYIVTIPGRFTLRVTLRTEIPELRIPTDAWTHMDLVLHNARTTNKVHGVIGQTFRKDHAGRAMKFNALVSLLGRRVAADRPSGRGFLDGSTADYKTSGVLAADCRFSAFTNADSVKSS